MSRPEMELDGQQVDYFEELYRSGVAFAVIAREFGVSHWTARRWAKARFRLPQRGRCRRPVRVMRKEGRDETVVMYATLPGGLRVRPARRRPRDRIGERWLQIV